MKEFVMIIVFQYSGVTATVSADFNSEVSCNSAMEKTILDIKNYSDFSRPLFISKSCHEK